jgi:hypothetical protein
MRRIHAPKISSGAGQGKSLPISAKRIYLKSGTAVAISNIRNVSLFRLAMI